jgi:DNA-binding NarL/FixJ family response regulator
VRQSVDVQRFREVAREAGGAEPFLLGIDTRRAEGDHRNPARPWVVAKPPDNVGAREIGQHEIEQDGVRAMLAGERDGLCAGRRLERPEAGGAQHVARELQVPLVVVDDQDERHGRIVRLMPIRVLLADDHYLVREGVRRLLESEADVEVVAVAEDLDSLLAAVEAERPDVVVTDIRMPPSATDEGIQAAEQLRRTHPDVGVVVLSQYREPRYALALLDAGTARRGYLLKERVDDVEQLVAAIRAVAEGESVIDTKVVEGLVAARARAEESPLHQLTPRELDVLREMAEGNNNAAIAASLFLTERSVEKVIHSIFQKLGIAWEPSVNKRVKAVILYLADEGG